MERKEIVGKLVDFIEFAKNFDCNNIGDCTKCPLSKEFFGVSLCGLLAEIDTSEYKEQ